MKSYPIPPNQFNDKRKQIAGASGKHIVNSSTGANDKHKKDVIQLVPQTAQQNTSVFNLIGVNNSRQYVLCMVFVHVPCCIVCGGGFVLVQVAWSIWICNTFVYPIIFLLFYKVLSLLTRVS